MLREQYRLQVRYGDHIQAVEVLDTIAAAQVRAEAIRAELILLGWAKE
jgi:hypothetical protein